MQFNHGWWLAVPVVLSCGPLASAASIKAVQIASGFNSPLFATSPPGDAGRLFVVEQGASGTANIKIVNLTNGSVLATPFLTISGITTGGERGLLGLAFSPDYFNSSAAGFGKFYVDFTDANGNPTVREYSVSGSPFNSNIANAATARDLFSVPHPGAANHNGGWIAFGPDKNLYIATGDGGNGNDSDGGVNHTEPGGNAQDRNKLLGKILRINPVDPDGAGPLKYSIPSTNRFAAGGGSPEIWAMGLRNPFRDSFDRVTGNLWIADVGQDAREEIDFQPADVNGNQNSRNYGWRMMEGLSSTGLSGPNPPVDPLTSPLFDYPHTNPGNNIFGHAIIGGYVYRGPVQAIQGAYFFADEVNGGIFEVDNAAGGAPFTATQVNVLNSTLGASIPNPSSFAEDGVGNVYIMSLTNGTIFRLVPEPASAAMVLVGVGGLLVRRRR